MLYQRVKQINNLKTTLSMVNSICQFIYSEYYKQQPKASRHKIIPQSSFNFISNSILFSLYFHIFKLKSRRKAQTIQYNSYAQRKQFNSYVIPSDRHINLGIHVCHKTFIVELLNSSAVSVDRVRLDCELGLNVAGGRTCADILLTYLTSWNYQFYVDFVGM